MNVFKYCLALMFLSTTLFGGVPKIEDQSLQEFKQIRDRFATYVQKLSQSSSQIMKNYADVVQQLNEIVTRCAPATQKKAVVNQRSVRAKILTKRGKSHCSPKAIRSRDLVALAQRLVATLKDITTRGENRICFKPANIIFIINPAINFVRTMIDILSGFPDDMDLCEVIERYRQIHDELLEAITPQQVFDIYLELRAQMEETFPFVQYALNPCSNPEFDGLVDLNMQLLTAIIDAMRDCLSFDFCGGSSDSSSSSGLSSSSASSFSSSSDPDDSSSDSFSCGNSSDPSSEDEQA